MTDFLLTLLWPITFLLVVWLIKKNLLDVFRVVGPSMQPTYQDGDILLVDRMLYRFKGLKLGDHVLFRIPGHPVFIKRISKIFIKDGLVDVEGDNKSQSTDSRSFGSIPDCWIHGKVVKKIGSINLNTS